VAYHRNKATYRFMTTELLLRKHLNKPIERVVGINMVNDNKDTTNWKTNTPYPTKKIIRITKTKK